MKKHRLLPRALGFALAVVLAGAAGAPAARATTPEQEAALATEQRSMNNPGGETVLPEANPRFWPMHPDTQRAGFLILRNVAEQFLTGNADPDAIARIFEYMPIVTYGQLPRRENLSFDPQLFLYMLRHGTRNIYLTLAETDEPDLYEFIPLISIKEGELVWSSFGIYYNAATGWITDASGAGIFYLGYEYNVRQTIRAVSGGWQRPFGFNRLYDGIARLFTVYIDTLRFPFAYKGKEYMLQLWKGYYGPSNGAEIGLYEASKIPFHWDASETEPVMSMRLYQGDKLFLEHAPEKTWWAGAFRYGNYLRTPLLPACRLRLTGTVAFEDPGMLAAFMAAFEGSRTKGITGEAQGNSFVFAW